MQDWLHLTCSFFPKKAISTGNLWISPFLFSFLQHQLAMNLYFYFVPCDMEENWGSVRGGSMLPAPFDILRRSPCSLPFFGARSFLPIFSAPFSSLFAPCSILIFPLAPWKFLLLHSSICGCYLLPFPKFCAPCSQITFAMLLAPFLILGHAPCSLGSKGPFSLLPDYP